MTTNRTRRALLTLGAVAALTACTAPAPIAEPVQTTARPTPDAHPELGPNGAAAARIAREAVAELLPWAARA